MRRPFAVFGVPIITVCLITITVCRIDARPAFIAITWPSAATVCPPANYPAMAAAITRIVAESATALARWKADRL